MMKENELDDKILNGLGYLAFGGVLLFFNFGWILGLTDLYSQTARAAGFGSHVLGFIFSAVFVIAWLRRRVTDNNNWIFAMFVALILSGFAHAGFFIGK